MAQSNIKNCTLVFLVKKEGNAISEVCLAMKKRGFGQGRWNGVGGKVSPNEEIEAAAVREAREEIDVEVRDLKNVAGLTFGFPNKPEFNQRVHVYFSERWAGEPKETEEMSPKWFTIANIPYGAMWECDTYWLPEVLKGKFISAAFTYGENDTLLNSAIKEV